MLEVLVVAAEGSDFMDIRLIVEIADLLALTAVISIACYMELRSARIPNVLTGSGMVMGLLFGMLPGGPSFAASVLGLIIGFGALFVFYAVGGIGGGDVKLMGAVGALLGVTHIVPLLFHTALIGAVMAILVLIWKGNALARCKHYFRKLIGRATDEQLSKETLTVPYGVAIAIGTLITLLRMGSTP